MDNAKLIDDVRRALDLPSDYALAKAWGIPLATMSAWRHGRELSAYFTMRAAETLDQDPRELIAERELRKPLPDIVRHYWETLVKKHNGVLNAGVWHSGLHRYIRGRWPAVDRRIREDRRAGHE